MARSRIRIDRLEWDMPAGRIDLQLTSAVEQTITFRMMAASEIASAVITRGNPVTRTVAGAPNTRSLALPAGKTIGLRFVFK